MTGRRAAHHSIRTTMTAIVLFLAAYLAVSVARRAYPDLVGETLSLDGSPITPRGALLGSGAIGLGVFALIATPWLVLAPLAA